MHYHFHENRLSVEGVLSHFSCTQITTQRFYWNKNNARSRIRPRCLYMFMFVIDVPIKYWIKNRNICRAYSNQDKSSIKIWNRSWNLSEWSVLLPVLLAKHLMRRDHNRNNTQTLHVWSAILYSHCPCSHILIFQEWEFCRRENVHLTLYHWASSIKRTFSKHFQNVNYIIFWTIKIVSTISTVSKSIYTRKLLKKI